MKILVVGGGGREHAIISKIKENPEVTEIFAAPGNGGIANDATCVDIAATDIDKIVEFAFYNRIDFAVVAPDDPLAAGMVDAVEAAGIRDKVKIMIGGAPITDAFCQQIGADAYTPDAASAADKAVEFCK